MGSKKSRLLDGNVDKPIAENGNVPALEVSNLSVSYTTETGMLDTVRDVSFRIGRGEIYGLVGESGSGKTTLARAVVRYLPSNGYIRDGSIILNGTNLLGLSMAEMRRVWGAQISMVHQDPAAAVNPAIRVGEQIAEVARTHLGMSKSEAREKALEMLTQVGMPDPEAVARRYAHQLSGGMIQRVLIATALTTKPQLLIMDEPTTALDVTTEAVILDLIRELLGQYQTAVLYITHNLGVIARVTDRVGVLYAGELMEEGPIREIFGNGRHPYTLGLLGCVPRVDAGKREIELHAIPGHIPRPDELPGGCIFAPRCALAEEECRQARPLRVEVGPGHLTACRRWQAVRGELPDLDDRQKAQTDEVTVEQGELLLDAIGVKKYFPVSVRGLSSLWQRNRAVVKAVDDISIQVSDGFTLGIVGESGCGKTTLARCISGLEEATAGRIKLRGKGLPPKVTQRPRKLLKELQVVFQNPDASLNPQHTVRDIVARPLALLGNVKKGEISDRVSKLLEAVHLPQDFARRLPHELSGGEKQRVAIARAFAADPSLMICDEPISSLDVSVQASLMNLLVGLQNKRGTAYLFISHDLAAVRYISDWIVVVYLGRLWEVGPAGDVFAPPYHPYTEALLSAIPIPDPGPHQERIRLKGSVPSAVDLPSGCRFHTRCPRIVGEICEIVEPPWQTNGPDHRICCHVPLDELRELQGEALSAPSIGRA